MENQSISAERVVEELAAIGFARATDFLCVRDGELEIRSTDELALCSRSAIASIERTTHGLKLKLYDKMKALELLGKHLGLFDGKNDDRTPEQNNLLEAILSATKEEVSIHDIPELQQAADDRHDLVEQTPPSLL